MKIIKSSVEILDQGPGIIGMFKHIEKCARVTYKSEDKITDDSYIKFVQMLYNRGHWAPFNLGTVYLKLPIYRISLLFKFLSTVPYTTIKISLGGIYITTNYRVICQLGLEEIMKKYWCDPTNYHKTRITSHWVCSRGIAQELTRHRILCPVMESTRYCAYSNDKFGSELTFILPQWVYRVRDKVANTIDSLTGRYDRDYIKDMDGKELWDNLCCIDRTVSSRDTLWQQAEDEYLYEVNTDEGELLKPEEARGVLPLDVKTELYLCGYLDDWIMKPKNSKEKCGFFYLRTAKDAHPDIRVLAIELENKFKEHGYIES